MEDRNPWPKEWYDTPDDDDNEEGEAIFSPLVGCDPDLTQELCMELTEVLTVASQEWIATKIERGGELEPLMVATYKAFLDSHIAYWLACMSFDTATTPDELVTALVGSCIYGMSETFEDWCESQEEDLENEDTEE